MITHIAKRWKYFFTDQIYVVTVLKCPWKHNLFIKKMLFLDDNILNVAIYFVRMSLVFLEKSSSRRRFFPSFYHHSVVIVTEMFCNSWLSSVKRINKKRQQWLRSYIVFNVQPRCNPVWNKIFKTINLNI